MFSLPKFPFNQLAIIEVSCIRICNFFANCNRHLQITKYPDSGHYSNIKKYLDVFKIIVLLRFTIFV